MIHRQTHAAPARYRAGAVLMPRAMPPAAKSRQWPVLLGDVVLGVMEHGVMKGECPNTVVFGVRTLLFANPISGILLLCSEKGSANEES